MMNKPDTNFIVTAPTTKIMNQATLPAFLKIMDGAGKLNVQKMEFQMPFNRKVYLRTFSGGKDPNAIEGCTNVEGIWNDEAGMLNLKCWTNIEGRSAFRQCPIFNSTTPYSLNFLYSDIYKANLEGLRDDIEFIQFRSVDNPYFPKEEFERQKKLLDPRVFAMKYEGQFSKMAGLVYMEFDEVENTIEPFDIQKHIANGEYYVCAGVDWGYTNEFAISVRCIHRFEANMDIQVDEFYKTHLTPTEKVQAAKSLKNKWGIEIFYCDCASPDMIAEFNSAGLTAVGCPKSRDLFLDRINAHQGLIKSRAYKLFRGRCPYTKDEYETYHYQEDDGDETNLSEIPVDAHNHLMDANGYVTQMTESVRREARERMEFNPAKSYTEMMLDGDFATKTEGDWYDD